MTERDPGSLRIRDLPGEAREAAVPIIKEGFVGVYRWHAKRTLRHATRVRGAFLGEAGEELAGVAMLERLVPEAGYVYYLCVARSRRRRGVGGALLDDAIAGFRRDGCQVVYAAIEADNEPSQAMVRSRGFRVVERKETSYRDGGLGAQGLRTRMWIVSGEELFGVRLVPVPAPVAR